MSPRLSISALPLLTMVGLTGCGSTQSTQQQCSYTWPLTVSPTAATLDHAATGIQNNVQFRGIARDTAIPESCPHPTDLEALLYATWQNPDPANIQISSAYDSTNGMASCIHATTGAVTLTGTFKNVTLPDGAIVGTPANLTYIENVTLTCK